VALLALSALLFLREAGLLFAEEVVWPLVLAAGGVALVWRQTAARPLGPLVPPRLGAGAPAAAGAARGEAAAGPRPVPETGRPERQAERLSGLYRGGFGVALIVGAGLLVLQTTGALSAARELVLATGGGHGRPRPRPAAVPVAHRAVPGRRARARIRSEERAEVAAHLHDSVLQTLALVQKRADDPRAVAALARRQERELRSWLGGERPADPEERFAAALQAAAEEVEEAHGAQVELVAGRRRAARRARPRDRRPPRARRWSTREVRGRGRARRGLRRGDGPRARGLRPRPRPGLRPRAGARGPPRGARVDRRAHGPPRRRGRRPRAPGAGVEVELRMTRDPDPA
jgi:hypothetical protein